MEPVFQYYSLKPSQLPSKVEVRAGAGAELAIYLTILPDDLRLPEKF